MTPLTIDTKKPAMMVEWEDCIEHALIPALRELRDRIREHNIIADADLVVDEIDTAIGIWELTDGMWEFVDIDRDDLMDIYTSEETLHELFWNYLRDNIRKWWE